MRPARSLVSACTAVLAIGLTWSAFAADAVDPAPHVVHDEILPELDRHLPGVLDVATGGLTLAPHPESFANEKQFKTALATLGDFAYEDADGGLLFVASGSAATLGTVKPTQKTLESLDDLIDHRDFLRGAELNPGSWFAARTRDGKLVLGRVVSRNAREIRLCWAPPSPPTTRFAMEWVEAIAAVGPPAIASAIIPPLTSIAPVQATKKRESVPRSDEAKQISPPAPPQQTVLKLRDGSLATGPVWNTPFPPNKLLQLVGDVQSVGDLAYFPQGAGMLVVGSRRVAKLGTGYVASLAGRDLRPRLRDLALLSLSEIPPGSVLLVESVEGHHALVRMEAPGPKGLRITWLNSPDGSATFPDLLAFDASFEVPDQGELDRRLLAAISRGDRFAMRQLLELGANTDTKLGRGGRSALMQAIINLDSDAIALLLESGADPNTKMNNGWGPLHAAAQFGRIDLVEALIAAGADPTQLTLDGKNPLEVALESPRQDTDLIRLLRDASGAPDTLALVARVGDMKALSKLIEEGVALDARHDDGRTALHIAAVAGEFEVVRALLEAGADPRVESDQGSSALAAAARAGQTEVVSALLEHDGSTDLQKAGALYEANASGDPELARMLLRHGADAQLTSGARLPAVNHAFQYGGEALVDVYVEAGHQLSVSAAARLGRAEELAEMLIEGGDPYEPSPDGSVPIAEAIKNDQLGVVKVLLDHGVETGTPLPTWDEKSPLHVAAERKKGDLTRLLLERGADPNQIDAVGRSPLYDAVVLGREENVRALLEHGADPNIAPSGETLLDATRSESLRNLLRNYGAVGSTERAATH